MKTLNIKSDGSIEFNYNGSAFVTDINDPNFPSWGATELTDMSNQIAEDGISELHFEDDGFNSINHKIKGGKCSDCSDSHSSNVFANLQHFVSYYKDSLGG